MEKLYNEKIAEKAKELLSQLKNKTYKEIRDIIHEMLKLSQEAIYQG